MNETVVMLSSFTLLEIGDLVSVTAGKTLVVISDSGTGSKHVAVYSRFTSSGNYVVPDSSLYCLINDTNN